MRNDVIALALFTCLCIGFLLGAAASDLYHSAEYKKAEIATGGGK